MPSAERGAILSRVGPFLGFGRKRAPPVPLVLYTRAGCGLCEELKRELRLARVEREWQLTEVDIAADPALEERWGRSIPVLEIGGKLAFKGRMSAAEFQRKFERLAAEWQRAQEAQG